MGKRSSILPLLPIAFVLLWAMPAYADWVLISNAEGNFVAREELPSH